MFIYHMDMTICQLFMPIAYYALNLKLLTCYPHAYVSSGQQTG